MTVLSAVYQDTDRFDRRFPAASLRSARKARLSPTVRLVSAGTTVTVATGADEAVICTRCMSLRPLLVAVIVAKPCIRPVTRAESPNPVTLAVSAGLLVHVTDGFCTGLPLASPTAANRVIVPPTPTEVGPEMRTYAPPPEPPLGSRTDKGVVLPAVTSTPDVVTESRFGRNGSSMRTT